MAAAGTITSPLRTIEAAVAKARASEGYDTIILR
jgi:hypothetical protein